MITSADISIVLQGSLSPDAQWMRPVDVRRIFPGAKVIASSFEGSVGHLKNAGFDDVVLSPDPGPLPSLKRGGPLNNINRQIISSYEGLKVVTTPYAIKLRSDGLLYNDSIMKMYNAVENAPRGTRKIGSQRILVNAHFTLNPRFDERMAYHVSDWIQLGATEDLLSYWSAPLYPLSFAVWYRTNNYDPSSTKPERQFLSRFAVEQWIAMHYAKTHVAYHNENTPEIVDQFEEFFVDNIIPAHPRDIGFFLPKYELFERDLYMNTKCYSFNDWLGLMQEKRGYVSSVTGVQVCDHDIEWRLRYFRFHNSAFARVLDRLPVRALRRYTRRA